MSDLDLTISTMFGEAIRAYQAGDAARFAECWLAIPPHAMDGVRERLAAFPGDLTLLADALPPTARATLFPGYTRSGTPMAVESGAPAPRVVW